MFLNLDKKDSVREFIEIERNAELGWKYSVLILKIILVQINQLISLDLTTSKGTK